MAGPSPLTRVVQPLLRGVLVALLWAILNAASAFFEVRQGISFFFPAAAVTVLAGAWLGWWGAAAVFLANFLSPWGEAVGVVRIALFGLPAAAWVLAVASLRGSDHSAPLRLARWIVVGLLGGSLLSAVVGNLGLLAVHAEEGGLFLTGTGMWWIADLAAAACFGLPLVVAVCPAALLDERQRRLLAEWLRGGLHVVLALVLVAAGALAVATLARVTGGNVHLFAVVLLPAVVVASWRGGLGAGLLANGLVSLVYAALALPAWRPGSAEVVASLAASYANLFLFATFAILVGLLAGENQTLVDEIREQGRRVARGLEETVLALATTLAVKERSAEGHLERVERLAALVGVDLGLAPERLSILRRGAVLHDIGQIGVPETLLGKPTPLSEEDRAHLLRQREAAIAMLQRVEFLRPVLGIVRYVRERWDGAREGPYASHHGLAGEAIPLEARIICAAEAYEAMTHQRPYRPSPMSREAAVAELWRCSGSQFDPRVVAALTQIVRVDSGEWPALPEL